MGNLKNQYVVGQKITGRVKSFADFEHLLPSMKG
jgi:hypothetical protein